MKRDVVVAIAIFVFVVALWLGTWCFGINAFASWAERGQFGDLFGSVNALFSGLAFFGVIAAILLQRQELALQRAELKLQREEMAASRVEFAAQAQAQNALAWATIGQIRVAGLQARIEAWKMESESKSPSFRTEWIGKIQATADQIGELAKISETGLKG